MLHLCRKENLVKHQIVPQYYFHDCRYKWRNGIIKAIQYLKVVTGDDSLISFFKHPVDGSTDKRMIYGIMQELISKFKTFGLEDFSVESTNESMLANISSESLAISSPTAVNL